MFLPNQSVTVQEFAEVMSLVPYGERITTLEVMKLFPNSDYPSRAEVAEVLVRKFMHQFEERLYLQGKNRIYFEELL